MLLFYFFYIQHILQREDNWNNWKNEGCPTFERERPKETQKPKNRYVWQIDFLKFSQWPHKQMLSCNVQNWSLLKRKKCCRSTILVKVNNYFFITFSLASPKRRRIGEDLQTSGGKIIKMGSNELTRLWNLNPDNMDACRSEKRLVIYFECFAMVWNCCIFYHFCCWNYLIISVIKDFCLKF